MAEKQGRRRLAEETRLVHLGRDRAITGPFVNPPITRGSTILFETVEEANDPAQKFTYGRSGTPIMEALETTVSELENAEGTVLCPSGLSAVSASLLSCLSAGDELLLVDSVYFPVRRFAHRVLPRMGVETVYYDPLIGAGIEQLFTEKTRVVYLEAPGSFTFEMQDIAAIAERARRNGILVVFDNSWATPLRFKPLDHGADIVVEAGTKFFNGHADVLIGTASASGENWSRLKKTHGDLGLCASPDDIYLTLRGMRTLAVRLERQHRSAVRIGTWLSKRAEIDQVLFPALPGDPGHEAWLRYMPNSGSLMGFLFDGWPIERMRRFVNSLELFGIGDSWAGFESLVSLRDPANGRSAAKWTDGAIVRLSIGLEDPDDLIADIEAALKSASTDQG